MKRYFVPTSKCDMEDLHKLPLLPLDEQQIFLSDTQTNPDTVLVIGEHCYCLMHELDREGSMIVGYLEAKSRKKTERFKHKDAIGFVLSGSATAIVTSVPHGDVVGYLRLQWNEYIAVTEQHHAILFVPIALVSILTVVTVVSIYFFWTPTITSNPAADELIDGGLTPTISEQLDPAYFNLKVNATPIIKDGSMNIRIENSERNQYNCYAEIEMTQGEQSKIIYRSPLIQPNQTLAKATLIEHYRAGVYDGKAYFSFYDDNSILLGKATVKLIINVV